MNLACPKNSVGPKASASQLRSSIDEEQSSEDSVEYVLSQPVVSSVGREDRPSAKTKVKVAVLNEEGRRDVEKCLSTVFASMRIMPYAAPCRMEASKSSASEVTSEFVNGRSSCGLSFRYWSHTIVGQIAGHAYRRPREIDSAAHASPPRQSSPAEAKSCVDMCGTALFRLHIVLPEREKLELFSESEDNPKATVSAVRLFNKAKKEDVTMPYIYFCRITVLSVAKDAFADVLLILDIIFKKLQAIYLMLYKRLIENSKNHCISTNVSVSLYI